MHFSVRDLAAIFFLMSTSRELYRWWTASTSVSAKNVVPKSAIEGVYFPMRLEILSEQPQQSSFAPLGANLKVLLVWPRFAPSFWGFEGVLAMLHEDSVSPPLGLITVAALCPPTWTLRLLDHTIEEIRDEDYRWADLVMVSAMHAQRADTTAILARARQLGIRTFLGGPWASSEPERLRTMADHLLIGEAEEVFADIALSLENGTAQAVYRVDEKPDLSRSPIPRFDLLRFDKYTSMSVQFSRGCPFQCEFCDIITIYGRKPRTKSPAQLIAELEALHALGWRKSVFLVDDNFIGNAKNALGMVRALAAWGREHAQPFAFYTEASVNLAALPELLAAMVDANFLGVFLGIETPSAEALKGTKKFQNLRGDLIEQVRTIQQGGLWVVAGFIVGFDSDDESIFDRQFAFIEQGAIAWAMTGMLQAPPTTPLFERMQRERRLNRMIELTSNFSTPNFRTVMPLPVLLRGFSSLLSRVYEPETYFRRSLRSLEVWHTRPHQSPPAVGPLDSLHAILHAIWTQGIRSGYRIAWWKFLWQLWRNFRHDPTKMFYGSQMLLAAHHFVLYSRYVVSELERDCQKMEMDPALRLRGPGAAQPGPVRTTA
jgi:radical SAM superfamily enzyme YgiQ (UPF0313 family)